MSDKRQFTPLEKKIIHALQQDLPVVRRPFAAVAERVGISEAEPLVPSSLQSSGQLSFLIWHLALLIWHFALPISHLKSSIDLNQ